MVNDLLARTERDKKIAAIIEPSIKAMGFQLVRVRLSASARPLLQIMAERDDGSMSVDDCAELSRALSVLLDVEDPIEGSYNLEISSPGLDRPLTREKDFSCYEGFVAKISTSSPVDGRKHFKGKIRGFANGQIKLETDDIGVIELAFSNIEKSKLVLTDEIISHSMHANRSA